jgi:hypothetical protein
MSINGIVRPVARFRFDLDQGKIESAAENGNSSNVEGFMPRNPQPSSRKPPRAKPTQRQRKGGVVPQPRPVRAKEEGMESYERGIRRDSVESVEEKGERDDTVCSLPEA